MLRWQDENRKELEKHFVLMHIDWIRDDKADAVLDRYSINREESTGLVSVLVDRDGVLLHDTTGESPYKEMQPSQFIDRIRTRISSWLNSLLTHCRHNTYRSFLTLFR